MITTIFAFTNSSPKYKQIYEHFKSFCKALEKGLVKRVRRLLALYRTYTFRTYQKGCRSICRQPFRFSYSKISQNAH